MGRRDKDKKNNADKIKYQLGILEQELSEKDLGKFWGHVEEINALFKELDLGSQDQETLWGRLGDLCDEAKELMEKRKQEKKSNARKLERQILGLRGSVRSWGEFWGQVKEVNELFETLALEKQARERLWRRLGRVCDNAKQKMRIQSKRRRELVEDKISEAENRAGVAQDENDLSRAEDCLREALDWMKTGWEEANLITQATKIFDKGYLTEEDRDECWERWKKVKEIIRYKREELASDVYRKYRRLAYDALDLARYEPREAKQKVKEIHQMLKGESVRMSQAQADKVYGILDRAWRKASDKLKSNYQEMIERKRGHISRWASLLDKNERIIADLERQIDDLQIEEAGARTEEYAEMVRSWIEEKYQKITDIQETNSELERKIANVREEIE